MRLLIDFLPILLFFGAYKFQDIYVATAVLMAATAAQMVVIYLIDRRLQTMHKVTLGMVLIFGALTLGLHDDRFIKWKPTVLYAAMAIVLAVGQWGLRRNFLQVLLGSQIALPPKVWGRLGVAWIGYCVFMSVLNGYVAAFFSTETWVSFKLWGYAFPVIFLLGQGLYISRHLGRDPADGSTHG